MKEEDDDNDDDVGICCICFVIERESSYPDDEVSS